MSLDTYPVAHVDALEARIATLERELEQAKEDRARAAMDARNPLLAQLAALEAEAKQAREDEAWGIVNEADVMSGHGEWTAQYWVDPSTGWISATAPTIAAALRALRAKVEGGAR